MRLPLDEYVLAFTCGVVAGACPGLDGCQALWCLLNQCDALVFGDVRPRGRIDDHLYGQLLFLDERKRELRQDVYWRWLWANDWFDKRESELRWYAVAELAEHDGSIGRPTSRTS